MAAQDILDRLEVVASWHSSRQRKVVDKIIDDLRDEFGIDKPEPPAAEPAAAPEALADPAVPDALAESPPATQ